MAKWKTFLDDETHSIFPSVFYCDSFDREWERKKITYCFASKEVEKLGYFVTYFWLFDFRYVRAYVRSEMACLKLCVFLLSFWLFTIYYYIVNAASDERLEPGFSPVVMKLEKLNAIFV